MTWPAIVQTLQATSGAVWAVGLCVNSPALWRVWRGQARRTDPYFAIVWFVALSQIGFIARWFIWPDQIPEMGGVELQFWAACYTCNAVAPAALMLARRSLAGQAP